MFLRGLPALAVVLWGMRAFAAAPEPAIPSDDTIQCVLQRGNTVMASTKDGIYQSSLGDKTWHKMEMPAGMPPGGFFAEQDAKSPRLAYFTGPQLDFPVMVDGEKGSLYLSPENGKTWIRTPLTDYVTYVFLQADGAIYATTWSDSPVKTDKSSFSWTENGGPHNATVHLLVSRDDGKTWRDITPKLIPGFGLNFLFRDPDHPNLVCVNSREIDHTSWSFIYQGTDATYQWTETRADKWHGGRRFDAQDIWSVPMDNTSIPAALGNFFKFPYALTGSYPDLPSRMLETDKPAYRFHLHDFMWVTVTSRFLTPDAPIKVIDMKDATAFWRIRVGTPDGGETSDGGRSSELSIDYPDLDARRARYANDPYLLTQQVDMQRPYQRQIDLQRLYKFEKAGKYRVQLTYDDRSFDRDSGTILGTAEFEVEILP